MTQNHFCLLIALFAALLCPTADAAHYKLFVLTGQSNSLGTTNGGEADTSPGTDPADAHVKFFWHNWADATTSLGDSGGVFTSLQSQQGGYYAGSATHWGPEINCGRMLYRAGVRDFGIIKCSRGGGGNSLWSKTSSDHHMYSHVVDTVNAATASLTAAGDTFEIVGLLYLQGESDSAAEAAIAGTRVKELTDNLRVDLPNAANLHCVIGGIARPSATSDTVRAKHAAIAASTSYIDYFSNLDLQTSTAPDNLHFNKVAKLKIGGRYAQAFFGAGIVNRHYGKLVFIGDSITQGGNGNHASYRYQIFKRLAEQGVPIDAATGYKFTGSMTGGYLNSAITAPDVNGQSFENVHDGHFGWRTFWENARVALPAGRYNTSNLGTGTLLNWTGQATTYETVNAGTLTYSGTTYTPDTVSIMIGINDLADNNNSASQVITDLGLLVDQLRASNPEVRIHINRLLYTNQTQALRNAVDAVNAQLPALADTKNAASATSPVWIMDASTGFAPATQTYDNVHPNAAGEVYVGDRIAAALGIIAEPEAAASAPPPHVESDSTTFSKKFEGNEIWDGSAYVNAWFQYGGMTKSLPEASDLKIVNPGAGATWLEGTNSGWNTANNGSWTLETRLKFDTNANGFVLWLGTDNDTILVEIYGNRTQDSGGETFNVAHNNLDGAFHTFRIANDAANARYHVWRDGIRLTPVDGVAYDNGNNESRMIFGDYTSGTFGNNFNATIDYVRYDQTDSYLPPGADADADGMTDAWEYQYFSSITGANPGGDPDEDGFTNLEEYQNGTNPWVADLSAAVLRVFLLTGEGNALGAPATSTLDSLAPGQHPAEQAGGVHYFDGNGWTVLAAAPDGSFGPELAFARLLWDAGYRDFGIVKSAVANGGNSLWQKGSADDSAYQALVAAASAAAATPPTGFDSVTFSGLLSVQGESNDATEANAAGTRFTELLANLKADLPSAAALKGVFGEIAGSGADRDTTRARQATLASSSNDIGLARAAGLAVHDLDGLAIHYDANSLFLLGSRMAAEAIRMNLAGVQPLPAWDKLHAWYVADHAGGFESNSAVARWGSVHDGGGIRDLTRRVSGQTFRTAVTANGVARQVMHFDGTNELWANASTEFGTVSGARTVAVLCRLVGSANGYLFDGATGTGRSRVQVRDNMWQAGVAPAAAAWDLAELDTAPTAGGWERHVFTFTPTGGNTSVQHWIDGNLEATVIDSGTATLGGFMVGSNGGSPFSRLPVDIAEIAVYAKALDATEVTALDAQWAATWGTPTGPPFSARVLQNSREIPRFGEHAVLEIPITAETSGAITLESAAFTLREGSTSNVAFWRIHAGATFDPSSPVLAEIPGGASTWSPTVSLPLNEGTNKLYLSAVPARYGPLGSSIDAAVDSLGFSGSQTGDIVPESNDPAGVLSLAMVPMFTDVRSSNQFGIKSYRIPGIASDTNGVLHAVFDHRHDGGADVPANIDIGYSRSTDGGATWSGYQAILDFDKTIPNSSGNGVSDPCILHDPATDTLWVAALWSFGNRGYNGSGPGTDPTQTGQYVLTKSEDGGLTWSAPINITVAVKDDTNWRLIFQGPGHGLAMRDGTLVFPSQRINAAGVVQSCSVFSTDHGATWDLGSAVSTSSPQTNENTVCELDDGRLLFSMRTPSGSNGQRAWVHYTPGGAIPMRDGSWESLYRLPAVPDPVCCLLYTSDAVCSSGLARISVTRKNW